MTHLSSGPTPTQLTPLTQRGGRRAVFGDAAADRCLAEHAQVKLLTAQAGSSF
jgi:hypothetical protein